MWQRAEPVEEHLEGRAVEQILAGVDLVADIDAVLLGMVEDRAPPAGQLVERGLDQPGGALRPRVDEGPGKCAGEGRHRVQPHAPRGRQRVLHLLHGPFLPRRRIAAHRRCREPVEGRVIGRVNRHQLALEMRRELGDRDAVRCSDALDLLAIVLRGRSLGEIEQPSIPRWDLHTDISAVCGPLGDRVPRVERRLVARELGEEERGALYGLHELSSRVLCLLVRQPAARRKRSERLPA